jgi:hypothetical protein
MDLMKKAMTEKHIRLEEAEKNEQATKYAKTFVSSGINRPFEQLKQLLKEQKNA